MSLFDIYAVKIIRIPWSFTLKGDLLYSVLKSVLFLIGKMFEGLKKLCC